MAGLLDRFDMSVLDDPLFKEDSVREEIVAPLLHDVGYSPSGDRRIVRTKPLVHPFVSIGSFRRPIRIYPDYLLYYKGRPLWVLDAKSPKESIDDPDHLQQAYSYAIHREVMVHWYALCNGRDFAIHSIYQTPIPSFRFSLKELSTRWAEIRYALSPETLSQTPKPPRAFAQSTKKCETRTAREAFDELSEVVAFSESLVKRNDEVASLYDRLTRATRDQAGGRFRIGEMVPIEWLVPSHVADFGWDGGTYKWTSTYLVKQQLIFGIRRGYFVEENILFKVKADGIQKYSSECENWLNECQLTLTFEGFLSADLKCIDFASL